MVNLTCDFLTTKQPYIICWLKNQSINKFKILTLMDKHEWKKNIPMFKRNTKCVHWCLWCLIHTRLACFLVETAKVTEWRIKGHLVMTQRTNHVVLTIGKSPTCKIVSATGLAFRLIDYGIHIVNCHTSLPVPMIEKWYIGAVWKLRCVYVIYKMKKKQC